MIEGAKLLVCESCAKHSTGTWEREKRRQGLTSLPKTGPQTTRSTYRRTSLLSSQEYMLVQDYGLVVRKAREKMGWSQEELGRKIQEKVSFIGKVESGKVTPDLRVVKKLEHVLGISLLSDEVDTAKATPKLTSQETRDLTIGDILSAGRRDKKGGKPTSNLG